MGIGVIKNRSMFSSFCFIFWWDLVRLGETMCLCPIVSGNICYVKTCFKTHDKTKEKTKKNGYIY